MDLAIFDPGGNVTALCAAPAPHDLAVRAMIARTLLAQLGSSIEQLGFVSLTPSRRVQLAMMGGEFCLNASRCAFRWAAQRSGEGAIVLSLEDGRTLRGFVEGDRVTIWLGDVGVVTMLEPGVTMVELPGITHFVVDMEDGANEREALAAKLDRLCECHRERVRRSAAIGLIAVRELAGDGIAITPLVRVPSLGTEILETACGSGSIAAYQALRPDVLTCSVVQPSGATLRITRDVDDFRVDGPVRPLGTINLLVSTAIEALQDQSHSLRAPLNKQSASAT